jgi:hypothetical protein
MEQAGPDEDTGPEPKYPVRHCERCGEDFEQIYGGKPRSKCYECSPPRLNQRKDGYATPQAEALAKSFKRKYPQSPPAEHIRTTAPAPPPQDPNQPHCPQCGAYPPRDSPVFPFCNPKERTIFAERVADAKRGGRPPLVPSKKLFDRKSERPSGRQLVASV